MPPKTVYVKESDLTVWNVARTRFGERGMSSILMNLLRQAVQDAQGVIFVVASRPSRKNLQLEFSVSFAEEGKDGFAPTRHFDNCQSTLFFLRQLRAPKQQIESVEAGLLPDVPLAFSIKLTAEQLMLFDPEDQRIERILIRLLESGSFGPAGSSGIQGTLNDLVSSISMFEPSCNSEKVIRNLVRLMNEGRIRLSKPDDFQYEAEFLEDANKKDFFARGVFNVIKISD